MKPTDKALLLSGLIAIAVVSFAVAWRLSWKPIALQKSAITLPATVVPPVQITDNTFEGPSDLQRGVAGTVDFGTRSYGLHLKDGPTVPVGPRPAAKKPRRATNLTGISKVYWLDVHKFRNEGQFSLPECAAGFKRHWFSDTQSACLPDSTLNLGKWSRLDYQWSSSVEGGGPATTYLQFGIKNSDNPKCVAHDRDDHHGIVFHKADGSEYTMCMEEFIDKSMQLLELNGATVRFKPAPYRMDQQ